MNVKVEWTVELEGPHPSDYVAANFVADIYVEKGEEAVIFALPENCHPGSDSYAEVHNTKITEIFDVEGTQYRRIGLLAVDRPVPEKYLRSEEEALEEMAFERMLEVEQWC